jgi:hypothetical protein
MVVARHACSAFARPPSKSCEAASLSATTAEEARWNRALLDSLVHPDSGIAPLSIGHDAAGFALPRPENRFFSKPKG